MEGKMLEKNPFKKIKAAVLELLTFYKTKEIGLISPETVKDPECIPHTELYITNKEIVYTYLNRHGKNKTILDFNTMSIKQNLSSMGMGQFIELSKEECIDFSQNIEQCFQEAFKQKLTLLILKNKNKGAE
jgi:hypothetical protein